MKFQQSMTHQISPGLRLVGLIDGWDRHDGRSVWQVVDVDVQAEGGGVGDAAVGEAVGHVLD